MKKKFKYACSRCRREIDKDGNLIGPVIEGKNISHGFCKKHLKEYKEEIKKMREQDENN